MRKRLIILFTAVLLGVTAVEAAQYLYQPGTLAVSFTAISAAAIGDSYALPAPELSYMNMHTFEVTVTSQPTSLTVNFEGSIDNVNWFTLATITSADTNWISGQGEMVHITYKSVRFVRCNATQYTPNGSTASCNFISGRQ